MDIRRRPAVTKLIFVSLLAFPFVFFAAKAPLAAPLPTERPEQKEVALEALPEREVVCTDGSVLKLKLLDEKLTLTTPYGKLQIPLAKIKEIECATRLPEDLGKRIEAAVGNLGHEDRKKREAASAELTRLRFRAYHALVKVEEAKDPEVRRRAKQLLEKIRGEVSEDDLALRPKDIIHTDDSKIAGQIEGLSLKVHTAQFGEVRLKLSDVRLIRFPGQEGDKENKSGALPDPGSLVAYQVHIGKTFSFHITGAVAGGNIWGTDAYTLDSTLAVAAVHAGVLKAGKTGVVRVKITAGRNAYVGSARNGIVSNPFMMYPGSFEFVKK
jgi:hypothetical protein